VSEYVCVCVRACARARVCGSGVWYVGAFAGLCAGCMGAITMYVVQIG
jgi:hypothetical protein